MDEQLGVREWRDVTEKVPHPAKYSRALLPVFEGILPREGVVLDPFAGVGGIHGLATPTRMTVGVELEPEWASQHPDTIVGDALRLPFKDDAFDAVCTSPTYGNRMADHHEAKDASVRNTYRHKLGRPLSAGSSAGMQWGDNYRTFHESAWREAIRVLKPSGVFVLNISDHIRAGERQQVSGFHVETILSFGFEMVDRHKVETQRNRHGANSDLRVPYEYVIVFRRGGDSR